MSQHFDASVSLWLLLARVSFGVFQLFSDKCEAAGNKLKFLLFSLLSGSDPVLKVSVESPLLGQTS